MIVALADLASRWPLELDPQYGCALWARQLDRDGYGLSWRGRIATRAHVAVYTAEVGPIPAERALDHACRVRRCVAPHHLEPVTGSENEKRKGWAYRARMATCQHGHDLRLQAIVMPDRGGRVCRACNRIALGAA